MAFFNRRKKQQPTVPSQMEPRDPTVVADGGVVPVEALAGAGVQVQTVGGVAGVEVPSGEPVDPWADPPAVDLGVAETIVEDGRTVMTDEQAMALLGTRLARGVRFMGGREDVRLVVHEDRDHDAWAWLDEGLVDPSTAGRELDLEDEEAPALHVSLGPLLAGNDPAGVNPLRPEGRRAYPSVPGGLAHVAAHLKHTRLDEVLLAAQDWPVRAAATMLEEVRCEARQIEDRPWDAVYLRASALLWVLPEGKDERWRTAYLALMTLGRRTAGILDPEDTEAVAPLVDAVFSKREKSRMMGVWSKALRLEDGDTQGLIDLAAKWVRVVAPKDVKETFADPCAARTRHMTVPLDGGGQGGGDGAGSGSDDQQEDAGEGSASQAGGDGQQEQEQESSQSGEDSGEGNQEEGAEGGQGDSSGQESSGEGSEGSQSGDSSGSQGADDPTSSGGSGSGSGGSQGESSGSQGEAEGESQGSQGGADGGQGQSEGSDGQGGGGQSGANAGGSNGWGSGSPDLEWDDPLALALSQVGQAANEGAKEDLEKERQETVAREERVKDISRPLDESEAAARERAELAQRVFDENVETGLLVHPATTRFREPSPGDERMCQSLEQELRKARLRDRGKSTVAFQEPPGRLDGRNMVQRQAQKRLGMNPTARPWRRQVIEITSSPMIYALVLADVSKSMQWAARPVASMVWAFSRAITAVGGKATAVTFGRDVKVLADAGKPLPSVPVYDTNDLRESFTAALKAGDGRMNLTGARGARVVFVISDGMFSELERLSAAKEMRRLLRDGVKIVWITLGVTEAQIKMLHHRMKAALIADWAPDGVEIVPITSQKQVGRIIQVMGGTMIREAALADGEQGPRKRTA